MKMERIKRNNKGVFKSRPCLWIIVAFVLGGALGFCAHYLIVNWHGFFAVCEDGTRPDRNGCCADEVYTDAGDGWMVCCPNGGDNCFPPMK